MVDFFFGLKSMTPLITLLTTDVVHLFSHINKVEQILGLRNMWVRDHSEASMRTHKIGKFDDEMTIRVKTKYCKYS